jgi:predicted CoA-substrate-specific enzyme activase
MVVGPSSTNPKRTAREIYEQALSASGVAAADVAFTLGTGYGRTQVEFADHNVSEITCHGRGAHFLLPSARTVIDIGGQDTKAISLDAQGNLVDFATNDKCAAGTGRFLEAMARSMEMPVEKMQDYYFGPGDPCTITSMCSVFAESEVINLINDGVPMPRIVKGLLLSLAGRVASLTRRLGLAEDIVMTGGVAKNRGVREAVEKKLKIKLIEPESDPQLAGALGAAIIAADLAAGKNVAGY